MLRLQSPQAECLWDEVLPAEVRELPEDLARIDRLLGDPALLEPIAEHWRSEALERGRDASSHGRPTIPMASYVRLMVIKHRSGWGYETLVSEVSDSLHLRRFCLLAIDVRVPRVHGPQADPPPGPRDRGPDHPRGDRQGGSRAPLLAPGRTDRLDRDRGRRALPLRRPACPARSASAGSPGSAPGRAPGPANQGAPRPLAGDRAPGAPDLTHDRAPLGRGS